MPSAATPSASAWRPERKWAGVLLYKARQDFALDRADHYLLATTLIGFGAWNVLDSIVFHWIMQIHHIRMDAASPLLWDLAWFMVFGVLFLLLGYRMRRGAGRPGGAASGRAKAAAASLALGWRGGLAGSPCACGRQRRRAGGLQARRDVCPGLQCDWPDQWQRGVDRQRRCGVGDQAGRAGKCPRPVPQRRAAGQPFRHRHGLPFLVQAGGPGRHLKGCKHRAGTRRQRWKPPISCSSESRLIRPAA